MKTFAELFQQELLTRHAQAGAPTNSREARGPMPGCYVQLATQSSVPRICDLCWANSRDYGFETVAKKKAIEDWLAQSRDLPRQNHVYASLKGRHYRSVSKRRWFFLTNGKAAARIADSKPGVRNPSGFLGMPQTGRKGSDRGWSVLGCQLEPASHREIFDYLQSQLPVKEVQDLLNYVIVKDTNLKPPAPSEDGQPVKKQEINALSVIFNIRHLGQKRGVWNVLSKKLTKKFPPPDVRKELEAKVSTEAEEDGKPPRVLSSTSIVSVWLVEGDANDDHYQQIQPHKFVRLYGDTCIRDSFGLGFSPLGFTQVNPSCVATMVDWTQRNTQKGVNIADFFCGYGLLGIQAAQTALPRRLVGLESSQEAIEWARRNQRRLPESVQARFQQSDLISSSGSKLERLLENVMAPPEARPRAKAGQKAAPPRPAPSANEPWQVIVDPPRIGLDAKLIETILTLNPTQIIHFVCNADLLFDQVKLWKAQGYHVEKLAVFDMFPGTDHLEIGMVLKPKRH